MWVSQMWVSLAQQGVSRNCNYVIVSPALIAPRFLPIVQCVQRHLIGFETGAIDNFNLF